MSATGDADTIYALASGTGRAAVSVLRVSGEQAFRALECLQGRLQPHAQLRVKLLKDPSTCETLDRAMTVRFCAPKSYTGEDMAEIHCHGSRAVVEAVLGAWRNHPQLSLRQAERGEFTRRALVAGKLSLTQVEGLQDLVAAETQAQRRQALVQSEGALAALYGAWEERIFLLLCRREAHIDFSDEELPALQQRTELRSLVEQIEAHLALAEKAQRVRTGLSVAMTGAPNVGKSSLLNRIALNEVAIVAATPGTTRDVVRVRMEIASLPVDVLDTAGLRRAEDAVEAEGIRRAQASAEQADLVVRVVEAGRGLSRKTTTGGVRRAAEQGEDENENEGEDISVSGRADMFLFNKSDLLDEATKEEFSLPADAFLVSARTGEGIEDFLEALASRLKERVSSLASPLAPTRARHSEALARASAELRRALAQEELERGDWALSAEALRAAHAAMACLVGKRDLEALLDRIFADFCIGK